MLVLLLPAGSTRADLELVGMTVTPHVQSSVMRYRRPPDPSLGARVQVYLFNSGSEPWVMPADRPVTFGGMAPELLVRYGAWGWHDTPSAWPSNTLTLPPGALTVWSFNGQGEAWGVGARKELEVPRVGGAAGQPGTVLPLNLEAPQAWVSSVTFLGSGDAVQPDSLVVHVANETEAPLRWVRCRLWLPDSGATWRSLRPQAWLERVTPFPADGLIPAHDRGGARLVTGRLPLTYAAVEVQVAGPGPEAAHRSLWAHLRIKREVFDLSGGWVAANVGGSNTLHCEPYLKTLARMHINAGMHEDVPGYTDQPALYSRYPLKSMNRFQPLERFDRDDVLPRIHAVEFLGEPQYGGGRPVAPMAVWRALAPYQSSRLPTSVTHSEERIWRQYAGLSDYPHFDAYRVCAPAPDAWGQYERWGDERLRWAAPLETIGDMTRSLRELNRPVPIAYWSQGAHDGWDRYGGRQRTSPTPDELRLQAYHALANRITSLYWFNLSLKSVVKFRDLIDPIARVGREVRMLDELMLEGDAYRHERRARADGQPDWELASVCGPRGGLLFALDVDYVPDREAKEFRFGPPRPARWEFPVPGYLQDLTDVFRVDADGVSEVAWRREGNRVVVEDRMSRVGIYVVAPSRDLRVELEARRQRAVEREISLGFDPATRDEDFAVLSAFLGK